MSTHGVIKGLTNCCNDVFNSHASHQFHNFSSAAWIFHPHCYFVSSDIINNMLTTSLSWDHQRNQMCYGVIDQSCCISIRIMHCVFLLALCVFVNYALCVFASADGYLPNKSFKCPHTLTLYRPNSISLQLSKQSSASSVLKQLAFSYLRSVYQSRQRIHWTPSSSTIVFIPER